MRLRYEYCRTKKLIPLPLLKGIKERLTNRMGFLHRTFIASLLIMACLLCSKLAFTQESPGIVQGNFAGSQTVRINPATMLQSKVYMDLQLLSVTAFGQNNFAYVPGKDYNTIPLVTGKEQLPIYGPNGNNFLYYTNTRKKKAEAIANIYGLSAMVQTGDHAFAFHTAARSYTSLNRVPYEVPIFGTEDLGYTPLHNIRFEDYNVDVSSMHWGEIGLSYAYAFHKQVNHHWAAGITAKYLMGYTGAFLSIDNVDYMVLNDSTINIFNMNASAGLALPLDYNNNDFPDPGKTFKGKGIGFDLGLTYTRKKEGYQRNNPSRICEQPYRDYFWRLGVSILDLGAINFKDNAQEHTFNDVNLLWDRVDTVSYTDVNTLMNQLSETFLGSPTASLSNNSFKIGLPTALSVQFDYHYKQNWYLNATWVQPFSVSQHSVRRPAQLAVTPRYETDWFEAMLPLSLYEYQTPRIGAAVRLGFFTIGTDRIGTLMGLSDLNGMDIYASIKINFRRGVCLGNKDTGACMNADNYKPRRTKGLFRRR